MNFSKIICIKVYVTNFTMKTDWALDMKNEKNWKEKGKTYFCCLAANVLLGGHSMKVNMDFQHCTSCSFWVHYVESVLAVRTDCGMSFNLYLEESRDENSTNACFEGKRVPNLLWHICSWRSAWRWNHSGLLRKISSIQPTVMPKNQSVLPKMLSLVLFLSKPKKFLIIFCIYHFDLYRFFAKHNTNSWSNRVSIGW